MRTNRNSRRPIMWSALIVLTGLTLSIGACDFSKTTSPVPPPDPIPAPVPVFYTATASGNCRPLTGAFQCTDSSACTADGDPVRCIRVTWEALNTLTGVLVQAELGTVGGLYQSSGILAGPYNITQTIVAQDDAAGLVEDTKVYNVVVP